MFDCAYFCGIDLAKNHFSIHAVDQQGKVLFSKLVTRSNLLTKIANIPPTRIDIEACGGAHYWARTLRKLGHDAHIIAVKSPKQQAVLSVAFPDLLQPDWSLH